MPLPLAVPLAVAGAGIMGNIASGWMGANAARDAARQKAASDAAALQFSKDVYQQTRQDNSPYLEAGQTALPKWQQLINDYKAPEFRYKQDEFNFDTFKDPGSVYRMQQAMKAINSSAAAKGGMGGGVLRNLQKESQDMASQEYANSFGRFMDKSKLLYNQASDAYDRENNAKKYAIDAQGKIVDVGANAAGRNAGIGSSHMSTGTQLMQDAGNAQAAGTVGASNAIGNAITGSVNSVGNALGWIYGNSANPSTTPKQSSI